MTDEAMDKALSRAERALARIERIAGEVGTANGADEALRGRVNLLNWDGNGAPPGMFPDRNPGVHS